MRIAVVGGVAAGTSAAAKARRENSNAEIVLFEKGKNISYAGCGLPYYISDLINDREKVVINTPRDFSEKYNVEIKIRHEVIDINVDSKTIMYKNLKKKIMGEYSYDKLIIATGAVPIFPPIPGKDLDNVITLRTVEDADNIKKIIKDNKIGHAVIVGLKNVLAC